MIMEMTEGTYILLNHIEMKEKQVKRKNRFFKIYQTFILILCAISVILFMAWYIPEILVNESTSGWITSCKNIAHSLMSLLIYILGLLFTGHIITILVRFIFSKQHSFIWLLEKQAVPLIAPIITVLFIKLFSGQLDGWFSDMIVGIFSGVVSSIIVLILDRKHILADTLTKRFAWEYADDDSSADKLE